MDNIVESIPQSTVFHNFSKGDKFSPIKNIPKDVENCGKLIKRPRIRTFPAVPMWENMWLFFLLWKSG
jgi:hypothetical protein